MFKTILTKIIYINNYKNYSSSIFFVYFIKTNQLFSNLLKALRKHLSKTKSHLATL